MENARVTSCHANGHLNDDIEDIQELQHWIGSGSLSDPGATASRFPNGVDQAPTCHAHHNSKGTRRDYIFITPDILQFVSDHNVKADPNIAVHSLVELSIKVPHCNPMQTILQRNDSLHNIFKEVTASNTNTVPDQLDQTVWQEAKRNLEDTMEKNPADLLLWLNYVILTKLSIPTSSGRYGLMSLHTPLLGIFDILIKAKWRIAKSNTKAWATLAFELATFSLLWIRRLITPAILIPTLSHSLNNFAG